MNEHRERFFAYLEAMYDAKYIGPRVLYTTNKYRTSRLYDMFSLYYTERYKIQLKVRDLMLWHTEYLDEHDRYKKGSA